jgi:hypothetical protein
MRCLNDGRPLVSFFRTPKGAQPVDDRVVVGRRDSLHPFVQALLTFAMMSGAASVQTAHVLRFFGQGRRPVSDGQRRDGLELLARGDCRTAHDEQVELLGPELGRSKDQL